MNLDLQADVISSVLLDITDDESIVRGCQGSEQERSPPSFLLQVQGMVRCYRSSSGLDGNFKLKREA